MTSRKIACSAAKWLTAGIGVAAASYAGYAGVTWLRYGNPKRASADSADELMDRFMPAYDVVDRHQVRVGAPADVTFAAATSLDLAGCGLVRGIFKAREVILGAGPDPVERPRGIVAETKSLGWGVLAEVPGREIVMGAATKPWEPNPVFRAIPADEFAAFAEPGYVKIVWTLRADPDGEGECFFRTETRAIATDQPSRQRFRWYWSFLSPGIRLIRRAMVPAVKAEAENRRRRMAA